MDFIILKVNGKDMSQASHEDALQAFLEAQEPIIVHVLRRSRNSSDQPLIADDNALSMSGGNRNEELNKESDRRSCICPRCGYSSTMSPQPLSLDSHDQEEVTSSGVKSPYGYNNQQRPQGQDDDDGPVYKEEVKITLVREVSQSTMGVACRNIYSSRDGTSAVIVDEVLNKNFRDLVRRGDRILEVNGTEVQSAEQVDDIFADRNCRQLELLVVRLSHDQGDGDSVEELRMSHLEELYEHSEGLADEEAFDESFNAHEKDSGLAESCRNDDSSENELMSPRSSKYNTTSSGGCDDLEELIQVRETGIQTESSIHSLPTRASGSLTSLENELLAVTLQMKNIQQQCELVQNPSKFPNLNTQHSSATYSPRISSFPVTDHLYLGSSPDVPPREEVYRLKSFRNSGPSNQKIRTGSTEKLSSNAAHLSTRLGVVKMPSPEFCEKLEENTRLHPRTHKAVPQPHDPPVLVNGVSVHLPYGSTAKNSSHGYPPVREVPRKKNALLHTVREDEELSSTKSGHIYEQIKTPSPVGGLSHSLTRPSGTRSSASKRPVRNKLLHERATHIAKERCGITTDDDAMSELRTGRYWSKEERRRQLEDATDAKRKRELQKVRQQISSQEATVPKIVTLSHQKFLKRQAKNPDDFTTPEELQALKARLLSEMKRKAGQVAPFPNATTV